MVMSFCVMTTIRRRSIKLESSTTEQYLLPESSDEGSPSHQATASDGFDDGHAELTEDDIIVEKMAITFGGKKGKHPVEMVKGALDLRGALHVLTLIELCSMFAAFF